jgi:hypothetical protein
VSHLPPGSLDTSLGDPAPQVLAMEAKGPTCQAGSVFERFTDSARQVLVLAQEEARLLGHSFIGTEHILLALIHADSGTPSQVLTELGASLPAVRERVKETIGLAGGPTPGSPPFTPRSKKVLELSLREALQLGHTNIGTEHILLGLVREGEGVGAQVLVILGIDLAEVRQRVVQQLAGGQTHETPDNLTLQVSAPVGGSTSAKVVVCSFCGLSPPESGQLVSGNNAFICENCVHRWSMRLGPRSTSVRHTWVSRVSSDSPPTGIEPEGADEARAEIRVAFAASTTTSDDGQALPYVDKGDNLGPSLAAASERGRSVVPEGQIAVTSADEIHFFDAQRALVWFSISAGDRTLLGRHRGEAVLVDGEWKMARATFCEIMAMAGVECPPESD